MVKHFDSSFWSFQAYDIVHIGKGENARRYPVLKGKDNWIKSLKERFPDEHEAIDKFFDLIDQATSSRR